MLEEKEFRTTVANNLSKFRKAAGLTQYELAEKINYSDKSVSKWERGEGSPDAFTLYQMAELFGISLNDFVNPLVRTEKIKTKNYGLIGILSAGLIWLVATFIYFLLKVCSISWHTSWMLFIYAIPAMFIVFTVFAKINGKIIFRLLSVSGIVWGVAVSLFLSFKVVPYFFLIFAVAGVFQVLTVIWYIRKYKSNKEKSNIVNIN